MIYLLDTNAVIAIMKGHPSFRARLTQHRVDDFAIPMIVAHELFFGAFKSMQPAKNLARLEALRFKTLPFDRDDASRSAETRAMLNAQGTPIGPYDILIAGQALARSLILITRNQREFQRLAGLKTEDWES